MSKRLSVVTLARPHDLRPACDKQGARMEPGPENAHVGRCDRMIVFVWVGLLSGFVAVRLQPQGLAQIQLNLGGISSNFSVWRSSLRPKEAQGHAPDP